MPEKGTLLLWDFSPTRDCAGKLTPELPRLLCWVSYWFGEGKVCPGSSGCLRLSFLVPNTPVPVPASFSVLHSLGITKGDLFMWNRCWGLSGLQFLFRFCGSFLFDLPYVKCPAFCTYSPCSLVQNHSPGLWCEENYIYRFLFLFFKFELIKHFLLLFLKSLSFLTMNNSLRMWGYRNYISLVAFSCNRWHFNLSSQSRGTNSGAGGAHISHSIEKRGSVWWCWSPFRHLFTNCHPPVNHEDVSEAWVAQRLWVPLECLVLMYLSWVLGSIFQTQRPVVNGF